MIEFENLFEESVGVIRMCREANLILKRKGISFDIDATEVDSHTVAVTLWNETHNCKRKVSELSVTKYKMIDWARELVGEIDALEYTMAFWNSSDAIGKHVP